MSKPTILPGEKHLKDRAEQKDLEHRLRELDASLNQAREHDANINQDQIRLLVEECEREIEMQEVPSEFESDTQSVNTEVNPMALMPLPVGTTALDKAKQMIEDIQNNPNILSGQETIGALEYGVTEEEKEEQKKKDEEKD